MQTNYWNEPFLREFAAQAEATLHDHPVVARIFMSMARFYLNQDSYALARGAAERTLQIMQACRVPERSVVVCNTVVDRVLLWNDFVLY